MQLGVAVGFSNEWQGYAEKSFGVVGNPRDDALLKQFKKRSQLCGRSSVREESKWHPMQQKKKSLLNRQGSRTRYKSYVAKVQDGEPPPRVAVGC
jgi:hypothetical protein